MAYPKDRPAPPPGMAKITVKSGFYDFITENVLWWASTDNSGTTAAECNTFSEDVWNAWAANILPHVSTEGGLQLVTTQVFFTDSLVVEGSYATGGAAGGIDSPPISAASCCCLSWATGLYYRGGKPRSYIGGIPASELAASSSKLVQNDYANALAAGAAAFLAAVNALDVSPITPGALGTLSFAKDKAWRDPPIPVPYTGVQVGSRLDTQRRRLGKETL